MEEKKRQEDAGGRKLILFGLRHPLITAAVILTVLVAAFFFVAFSSALSLAGAGLGAVVSYSEEGGYFGGSGEEYEKATATQKKIVDACYRTPAAGEGLCATWVYSVYLAAGFLGVGGNANDMWAAYCETNDTEKLEVGMIVAVEHSGPTGDSWLYGHVGIYIGDDKVMHSTGAQVEVTPLADWVAIFDPFGSVKWGFPEEAKRIVEKEKAEKERRDE